MYVPRIRSAPQQRLDEELVVEDAWRRIKRRSRDGGVDFISGSNRVPV
jgi:hypothetical protein